ncbi:glycosyltransferase [Sebaldella sp. S0638]|uniref:glycosyltransferase n=1 Tax=Sebaldella sp. S0638 TaxID=2957809 RepID=UPI0020A1A5F4|nr:glycosyltransferase [Sebaldella sp. S0638]MCP1223111.1 glycosyltransferase [Sebaldella sp. S0638]
MINVCFFNSEKKWGGGEKWHFKMAKLFSGQGYNVILAGRNNSELLLKAHRENMNIRGFNIGKYSFLNIVKIFQIYKFLKKNNIDTIFMNSSIDLKLCFIPCKMAGIKNVVYRRGMPHPIKNTLLNRLIFSEMLTKLIVNSKEIERSIFINNDKIISKDKVLLLYNGIDKNDYKNNGKKLYNNDESLVIFGNSGRLVEQKGQIHLLEAAKILKEKGHSFRILIAGKGKLEDYLKEKINEYNLNDEVILLGFIDKIEEFMNSMDIFVFPSYFEGSANAIVEAMYFGKPVVCFDVSSMPELVEDNENGYLVEYHNIDELARKMEKFLENPELIGKMGKKSKELSEDYDILKIMKKLENSILEG